jgi:hypothetical protein
MYTFKNIVVIEHMKFTYLLIYFYFIFTNHAFAYLDPFSGSLILQLLVGIGAAILAFFGRIKKFILNIFRVKPKQFDKKKKDETDSH